VASNGIIFSYADKMEFKTFVSTLNGLESLLDNSDEDEICQQAAAYIICNYVFIPCNLTTGNPRPICTGSCNYYFNIRCKELFATVIGFASVIKYPFMNNCPNTLSHLQGFGYSFSSDSFADDCIDIVGMYII